MPPRKAGLVSAEAVRYSCGMHPFEKLIEETKAISAFSGWSAPEAETGYIWFDAPLEIGGVTERGFVLHGGSYIDKPESHVSFEMRVSRSPGRRCVPLARIDWRSLQGGHTNPRVGGSDWSGIRVGNTHFHTFELNWSPESGRMRRGGLRQAMEIDQEPQSFTELRDFVGNRFKINNMNVVTEPPWEYRLDI